MRQYLLLFVTATAVFAAERATEPTFLRRRVPDVAVKPADVSTGSCHYKPIFGLGDPNAAVLKGIARFGEITVDPGGSSEPVSYPAEEQVYVVLEGEGTLQYGDEQAPVRRHDFLYLPPGIRHGLSNRTDKACRLLVMGFKIPRGANPKAPPKLLLANIEEVPTQVVGGHPPSTLYRLLMGDARSTRDRLAAASVLTSLFVMEIAPGGTNLPHHHEREEEIYLLLEGEGEMVAGGGMDGVEGRHPARPGDAYFVRLNCTVGFYNTGAKPARILAVRSLFPFRAQ
ncbi:MAG: cupin domain-containing protein [Acidobacteria bacterium]|nr:cupin domain-containing protein [Acidobacteriota bacterium]